jgi:hypothetical protein
MGDGSIANTDLAQRHWQEDTYHDGFCRISRATGTQWNHESLYLSRNNRFYVVSSSQWEGSQDSARYVSNEEAVKWLLVNGHEVPEFVGHLVSSVEE